MLAIGAQRCWVVDCKTPDCGVLVLAVIGENEPSKIHFLKRCEDFTETCEDCRAKHLYTRADVREENVALRENIHPSRAFLEATQSE
jgi:hypothetical protein